MADEPVSPIKKLQDEVEALFGDHGMTLADDSALGWLRRFIHFWVLVWRNFVRNRCLIRASALAYTTLLALIPLLAIGLGASTRLLKNSEQQTDELIHALVDELAPQLGLSPATPEEKSEARAVIQTAMGVHLGAPPLQSITNLSVTAGRLAQELSRAGMFADHDPAEVAALRVRWTQYLQESLPGLITGTPLRRERRFERMTEDLTAMVLRAGRSHDENRQKVVEQIKTFIFRIHSGALGLTGTVALVFIAIGLLSTIENTFNDIWGVSRGRNWFARVIYYWAAITLGPLLIILMMGLAIGSEFTAVKEFINDTPVVGRLSLQLLPFLILCGSFHLLYQLMPNTRVRWKAALSGALVASLLWMANGKFNALFTSKVVSASTIYGSLGAVPIFLFGLYLSWTILLFGAQVAYAYQNRRAYLLEKQAESVNQSGREFVGLRLMIQVARQFGRGERPPTISALAESLNVSSRLVSQILQLLVKCRLLVEVATPETSYCPARPLNRITCGDVLHSLRTGTGWSPATRDDPSRTLAREAIDSIRAAEDRVAVDWTLEKMAHRAESEAGGMAPPPAGAISTMEAARG